MNHSIQFTLKIIAGLLSSLPLASLAEEPLQVIVITASTISDQSLSISSAGQPPGLAHSRSTSGDTASLLRDIPGVSLYGAGGVSSLPAIHGMADDRVRIKVDGMDLVSACANHMNPPLSYIDPSNVGNIKVFAGITPVSIGGDSIGGTISVSQAAPVFAKAGQDILLKGQAGVSYRSNGNAKSGNLSAIIAGEKLNLTYAGSSTASGNYKAARDFKLAGQSRGTAVWLAGDEVGSSRYKAENQSLGLALRHENHLVELKLGYQHIPYQGFPNQWMDMTGNESHQLNLRYSGQYQWGALEARLYRENTRHKMNFLEDKLTIASPKGMPMDTDGRNTGALLKADIALSGRDILRVGSEYQRYRLNDWWDPVTLTSGMMGPNVFWSINNGQRDRIEAFGEWEARWNPQWLSQLGVRGGRVKMDTGSIQGYNNDTPAMGGMGGMAMAGTQYANPADPRTIPGAFNAANHKKTDNHIDLTALARYTPDAERTFEAGYARKTRSPNLYERFAWSTSNSMVMKMINLSGDANGYVGKLDLEPEVAHTLSVSASWHDAAREQWALKVTPYHTRVEDYIDASRCKVGAGAPCTAANRDATTGFVFLQFVNQSARLYGADVSGYMPLGKTIDYGSFTATGVLNYVSGKNLATGNNLYNIMPLNAKLAVVQRLNGWTNTIEAQWVDAKTRVAQVQNELNSGGYGLLNLRSSKEWKRVRLDVGMDNLFNKLYSPPLGGVYVGQRTAAWGTPVPGMGRSLYSGLTITF